MTKFFRYFNNNEELEDFIKNEKLDILYIDFTENYLSANDSKRERWEY